MHIQWTITKERGNIRPVLSYRVQLEDHEKALALPGVNVRSSIPKPDEHTMKYCYPGRLERADNWKPVSFYTLEAPSHLGHPMQHTLTLPWREDNSYPEVEESFTRLRDALEAEIQKALASAPMEVQGCVRTSLGGKQCLAAEVASARFLRLAREKARVAS